MITRREFLKQTGIGTVGVLLIGTEYAKGMVYRPAKGAIWDASVIFHDGKYFMFSMYLLEGGDREAKRVFLATSDDGVHWKDVGVVITSEARPENTVCAMRVLRVRDGFVMNHGGYSKPGSANDTLCFWESKDLIHWNFLGENHPDPRWYNTKARWDHMTMFPKEEGNPSAGYWGYVVAEPNPDLPRAPGMMQSRDGREWEILPPPKMEWGDIPQMSFEYGGCARIGERYYLIGGTTNYMGNWCYSVFTFVGDSPTGPFRPDAEAFRLCGASGIQGRVFVQALASFARGNGELLITNSLSPTEVGIWTPGATTTPVWLLPLRKAVVDADGHLRPGYWRGNDAAKGDPLTLALGKCEQAYPRARAEKPGKTATSETTPARFHASFAESEVVLEPEVRNANLQEQVMDRRMLVLLRQRFDLARGVILEGTIQVNQTTHVHPCYGGFCLEEKSGGGVGILLEVGHRKWRRSEIGNLAVGNTLAFESMDVTGPGCATVTGIDNGKRHSFRLWIRKDMFELYIDDLLFQTFLTKATTGVVGFFAQNGTVTFRDLRAWQMNLT